MKIVAQSSYIKRYAIKEKPGWATAGFLCYGIITNKKVI